MTPLDPQPRSAEVSMLYRWKLPNGEQFFYHAMEVGQGRDTQFFRCEIGEPEGVEKRDGVWFWKMKGEAS